MKSDPTRPCFVIEIAIAPKFRTDHAKLRAALVARAAEDPAFGFSHNAESGQIILKGIDEDHLDRTCSALQRDVDMVLGAPAVAYRETLKRCVKINQTYKKQGEFARIKFVLEPTRSGKGLVFEVAPFSVDFPDDYIRGIEMGFDRAMEAGIFAGFPVIDVKATLIDGAYHKADSSAETFERCAIIACRTAFRDAGCVLLEPIMVISIATPADYLGSILGDLKGRRGKVVNDNSQDDACAVTALVPFANLFGYANQLRSFSRGHARFTQRFSHYTPIPMPPEGDGPLAVAALRP